MAILDILPRIDYLVGLQLKKYRMSIPFTAEMMLHHVAELHPAGADWGTWDIKMS